MVTDPSGLAFLTLAPQVFWPILLCGALFFFYVVGRHENPQTQPQSAKKPPKNTKTPVPTPV